MAGEIVLMIIVFLLALQSCDSRNNSHCAPSSCGNISKISYPFRLQTDPNHCGDQRCILFCENNVTVLYLNEGRYYVQAINYLNFTIRLVDSGLDKHDHFSIPHFYIPVGRTDPYSYLSDLQSIEATQLSQPIYFIRCLNPVLSPIYMDSNSTDSCCIRRGVNDSSGFSTSFSCLNIDDLPVYKYLMDSCGLETVSMFPASHNFDMKRKNNKISAIEIHTALAFGFDLSWFDIICEQKCHISSCYLNTTTNHIRCLSYTDDSAYTLKEKLHDFISGFPNLLLKGQPIGYFFVLRFICGTPIFIGFLIYKWRKRHLSGYNNIEEFLQSNNNLMPIRYSYSDIKKMTGGFKDKLGEGGFGSVYKGQLRSGQFAAVKMLDKSKAKILGISKADMFRKSKENRQDFINEVATVGRIHHANVVKLIGFCVEGSKCALVYEFMSKGSLDNYISCTPGNVLLSWEKLYQISLGVARGIEYLHRGCEKQILHFDIKPNNILLDENFTPRISDFGLAKLYPTKGSIAPLTKVVGTTGYMAPELFYQNIGRVSSKADVYSFGMLLLELIGKKRTVNPFAENSSEIFHPIWVYNRLSREELEIEGATEEENTDNRIMVRTIESE